VVAARCKIKHELYRGSSSSACGRSGFIAARDFIAAPDFIAARCNIRRELLKRSSLWAWFSDWVHEARWRRRHGPVVAAPSWVRRHVVAR